MVGDHAEGNVGGFGSAISFSRKFFGGSDQVAHEVDVVVGKRALKHRRDPLQSHAGVHMFGRQFGQLSVLAAVVLDEDQIPQLDEAGAIAVHPAAVALLPLSVAGPGAAIDVDLAAGAAGSGLSHFPEIILLAEAQDALGRKPAYLAPELLGILVRLKYRRPKLLLGQAPLAREQLPRPGDRLFLVVIAEGPVAQHLEEGVMVSVAPDRFEVVVLAADAQALLRARRARVGAPLHAEKDVLELDHARVGEEQRRVLLRHQRGALHHGMALPGEVVQEGFSDFVPGRHRFLSVITRRFS